MKEPNIDQRLYVNWSVASAMIGAVKDSMDDTIFEDFSADGVKLQTGVKLALKLVTEVERMMQLAFKESQKSQGC